VDPPNSELAERPSVVDAAMYRQGRCRRESRSTTRMLDLQDGFVRAVQASDPDVVEIITQLMPLPPAVIACWIRLELPWLEERFAS